MVQKARPHPAGKLAFKMKGDAVVGLVNDKLASYLPPKTGCEMLRMSKV